MLSRRDILIGTGLAGVAALARPITSVFASAAQPKTPVNFKVPAGACDCHTHIFGDPQKFPFATPRVYTPETASVEEMRSLHQRAAYPARRDRAAHGLRNGQRLHDRRRQAARAGRARHHRPRTRKSPTPISTKCTAAAFAESGSIWKPRGQVDPGVARQRVKAAIERIKDRKWHIEIYTRLSVIEALKDQIDGVPRAHFVRSLRRSAGAARRRSARVSPRFSAWSTAARPT